MERFTTWIGVTLLFSSLCWGNGTAPALKQPPQQKLAADPLMNKSWHLNAIEAAKAWSISEGDPKVTVAVIDSGVDYNFPELSANIRRKSSEPINGVDDDGNGFIDDIIGWDFVKSFYLPMDKTGHGTFMAYLIAGILNNGIGGAGVCPRCSILPVRFINYEGMGDTEDAIKGIEYAVNEGVSVINLSFAGEGYDKDLKDAITYAGKKDVVVVVSAGNDGENIEKSSVYPAKFELDNQMTVTASTPTHTLMENGSWSKRLVHIAAPGDEIVGPWNGKWDEGSGTSQAAAVAAGAVGLVRSIAPDLNASEVIRLLEKTVTKSPALKEKVASGGVINVAKAAECARNKQHPCLHR